MKDKAKETSIKVQREQQLRELAALRNRELGFVFQAHHLLPQCSALENVLVPTLVHPVDAVRDGAEQRARDLLGEVGLGHRLDHRPAQLSGGEQQMLAISRVLMTDPRMLLVDSPAIGLAPAVVDLVYEAILDLHREGLTMLFIEQNAALALAVCDHAYLLHRGEAVLDGPSAEMRDSQEVVDTYLA